MLMIILLQNMPLTGFPTEQTALRIRVSTNLTNKVKSLLRKHRKTLERKRIKYPLIHQIIGKGFCQSGTKSNTGGEIHHKAMFIFTQSQYKQRHLLGEIVSRSYLCWFCCLTLLFKEGVYMKYINASAILPDMLVEELKKYVQARYIYIPTKDKQHKP